MNILPMEIQEKIWILYWQDLFKEKIIKTKLDNSTRYKVFNVKVTTGISKRFSGNFNVQ